MIFKILRIAGLVALISIIIFVIAALLGPSEFHVERSIVIHAPRSVIFANIADYDRWRLWSALRLNMDSTTRYEYYGPQGQADAGFRWSSRGRIGRGDMHTTELAQDVSLVTHITYQGSFHSPCVISFTLDSAGVGDIRVTAVVRQNYPFKIRPLMLLINAEKKLGAGYEKDLANLKKTSEDTSLNNTSAMQVKEIQWEKKIYVAHREKVAMNELSAAFRQWMPKVYAIVMSDKMVPDGAVTGLYYTWDTVSGMTDLAIAVPVKETKNINGDYQAITVDASRAVSVDYYGPYDKMKPAHEAIQKYIADKGLQLSGLSIEEYISDPMTEKEPAKILTRITYLTR